MRRLGYLGYQKKKAEFENSWYQEKTLLKVRGNNARSRQCRLPEVRDQAKWYQMQSVLPYQLISVTMQL